MSSTSLPIVAVRATVGAEPVDPDPVVIVNVPPPDITVLPVPLIVPPVQFSPLIVSVPVPFTVPELNPKEATVAEEFAVSVPPETTKDGVPDVAPERRLNVPVIVVVPPLSQNPWSPELVPEIVLVVSPYCCHVLFVFHVLALVL